MLKTHLDIKQEKYYSSTRLDHAKWKIVSEHSSRIHKYDDTVKRLPHICCRIQPVVKGDNNPIILEQMNMNETMSGQLPGDEK